MDPRLLYSHILYKNKWAVFAPCPPKDRVNRYFLDRNVVSVRQTWSKTLYKLFQFHPSIHQPRRRQILVNTQDGIHIASYTLVFPSLMVFDRRVKVISLGTPMASMHASRLPCIMKAMHAWTETLNIPKSLCYQSEPHILCYSSPFTALGERHRPILVFPASAYFQGRLHSTSRIYIIIRSLS
jgi:hypothetical protein